MSIIVKVLCWILFNIQCVIFSLLTENFRPTKVWASPMGIGHRQPEFFQMGQDQFQGGWISRNGQSQKTFHIFGLYCIFDLLFQIFDPKTHFLSKLSQAFTYNTGAESISSNKGSHTNLTSQWSFKFLQNLSKNRNNRFKINKILPSHLLKQSESKK